MKLKILRSEGLENKIAVLVGTRPGIIKMSPLIWVLQQQEINYFTIHAGQHYSPELDDIFFEELGLPQPDYKLTEVKKCTLHGEQTAKMLEGIEQILIKEKPKVILVCGDANYNLAGALAARKLNISIGHVEAGLRSHDWEMPEEHNRVIIDHISEYLFAPTEEAENNLRRDDVRGEILVTGNTIVDAVFQNLKIAEEESTILEDMELIPRKYFVVTIHREENVDNKEKLTKLVNAFQLISRKYKEHTIVFPIHPRTVDRLEKFNLMQQVQEIDLHLIEPLGYLDFLKLLKHANLVLTDSGGIQEESCILQVPCVTLRENTERDETLKVGSNVLAGTQPERILKAMEQMLQKVREWPNPFGEGETAQKIIEIVAIEEDLR